MTILSCVLLAALSVWDCPARQAKHEALRSGFISAMRTGNASEMADVAGKGVELLPDEPVWRYNLACAEARLGNKQKAFEHLERAIWLGFRDPGAIEEDSDFKAYTGDTKFQALVLLAERLQSEPLKEGPYAAVPVRAAAGGTVTLSKRNLTWNFDAGCFLAKLQIVNGVSDGNAGDLYMNRDANHSVLKKSEFPGVTVVALDKEGHARGADLDLPNMMFPCPVFGNCSRAMTQGKLWRSLPRAMVTTMAGRLPLFYKLYMDNQFWVFPAVSDCPPLGKLGDVFASVTPYCLATQGRSWSDQYYLKAALDVSRALPREVKREIVARKLLSPTIQALLRRSLLGVETEEDYLSPKAHPTAFPAEGLDLHRLRTAAASMTVKDIAPVAVIGGVAGSASQYAGRLPEMTYASPCAWAFVLRGPEETRTFKVMVSGGESYAFAQVHGDPEAVKIARTAVNRAELRIDKTRINSTNRVDVAVFAKSKTSSWGAPSFLSFAVVDPEAEYADPFLTGSQEPQK